MTFDSEGRSWDKVPLGAVPSSWSNWESLWKANQTLDPPISKLQDFQPVPSS